MLYSLKDSVHCLGITHRVLDPGEAVHYPLKCGYCRQVQVYWPTSMYITLLGLLRAALRSFDSCSGGLDRCTLYGVIVVVGITAVVVVGPFA